MVYLPQFHALIVELSIPLCGILMGINMLVNLPPPPPRPHALIVEVWHPLYWFSRLYWFLMGIITLVNFQQPLQPHAVIMEVVRPFHWFLVGRPAEAMRLLKRNLLGFLYLITYKLFFYYEGNAWVSKTLLPFLKYVGEYVVVTNRVKIPIMTLTLCLAQTKRWRELRRQEQAAFDALGMVGLFRRIHFFCQYESAYDHLGMVGNGWISMKYQFFLYTAVAWPICIIFGDLFVHELSNALKGEPT
jgi:hypothetical protein